MADLVTTLQELRDLDGGFVSLTEALDLTTPSGRAIAGLLAVFAEFEREILRERVRAGLAHARESGIRLGRPPTAGSARQADPKTFPSRGPARPPSHVSFRSAGPWSAALSPRKNSPPTPYSGLPKEHRAS